MSDRKKLRNYSNENKKNSTLAESILWGKLRKYIMPKKKVFFIRMSLTYLDFYCIEGKFGIEIDGKYHEENGRRDMWRQEKLLDYFGIRILRFENEDILKRCDAVLEIIEFAIDELRKDK